MRIGIFSKLGSSGGSEHRCAEICNAILRHSTHRPVLLCEDRLNNDIKDRLNPNVQVVTHVFKPQPLNVHELYSIDRLVVVNSDCYSFTRRAYWNGETKHHQASVDLSKIPQMAFLFNFVLTPACHLWELAEVCPDVRVICANRDYSGQIRDKERFAKIRGLPRLVLESPIDPETISTEKKESACIRIGKHSKAFGYKFNGQHSLLIERINAKFGDRVKWDFLGVPPEHQAAISCFDNVTIRPEYSLPVASYLENIDIFLFFIDWARDEPWSRAVAEAMMSGCPVLATDRAGNQDQIEHENTGYLCKSVDDFEKHLTFLIEHSDAIRRLGQNARIASKRFTSKYVIATLCDFLTA